jgi:hypothetical protein
MVSESAAAFSGRMAFACQVLPQWAQATLRPFGPIASGGNW